jgi:tetratricopeptide (TPR) repeat protein
MTNETETPQGRYFVTARLPWLLGAGMFVVFFATLSHWVTPKSLTQLADTAGWSASHDIYSPVTFVVTYPFRWLPVSILPFALNLFSAVWAALSLVQLARSVSLLPHDRTNEQRVREQSEFSVLTIRTAWAPPLFAVLVCGLQWTFWENAIQATGEMFNLFLFAYVIRCLLEYRITQRNFWLTQFAFVYGLGMANGWTFIGFFPAFLVAVIWIKGLGAFQPGFIIRTLICGFAGLSFLLLFPLLNSLSHTMHSGFWETMRTVLVADKGILLHFPREVVLLLGLTSLLPVFVIGIRWASYFGDNSPLGIFLAKFTFHIVHGVFFIVCLWTMMDSPISPRALGLGLPFLSFYYLGALSIGYFIGYFLLVFGAKVHRHRASLNPLLKLTNRCVLVVVWLIALVVPAIQVCKNFPMLQMDKAGSHKLENYFAQIEGSLPTQGAVVMSDEPFRLYYLAATANRHGKESVNLFIDTGSLDKYPGYLSFLAKKNPRYQISTTWTNIPDTSPPVLGLIQVLDHLSQNHELYYIHPSFGYYFEHFYPRSQGLIYQLRAYATNTWDPPELTQQQIAENQSFWKKTYEDVLTPLIASMGKPSTPPLTGFWGQFLDLAHLKVEPDRLSPALAAYYSRSIDTWGVDLQCAGLLPEAGKYFEQALELNPANLSARLNQYFNKSFSAGQRQSIQPPKDIEERMGARRVDVLNADGPIDEPNFRVDFAAVLADGGNYRQAMQQLERVKKVAPQDYRSPLELAQLLIYIQTYTNGLATLLPYTQCYNEALSNTEYVLSNSPDNPIALFLKGVALIQLKDYDKAIEPLSRLLVTQTNNYAALLDRAIANYKLNNLEAAKADYTSVAKVSPKAYQVYYGLGEIAYQQKDTPAAIKNYQLYLSNAPPNTAEVTSVTARLKELKAGAP